MNGNSIIILVLIVWTLVLTGVLVWILYTFRRLIKITKDKEFIGNSDEIKNLKGELKQFEERSQTNINRVGLVKFNPFNETGGDHSFSLALLDGLKNGIIITSLHTRERTRVYLKEVLSSKSKIELSKEEKKALDLALK